MTSVSIYEARRLARRVAEYPGMHLILPSNRQAKNPTRVLVTRDGLRMSLHRLLYEEEVGDLPPNRYLLRTCDEPRCLNPYHFALSSQPYLRRARCYNGHEYTEADRLPGGRWRCRICWEARLAKRRVPGANGKRGRKPRMFCEPMGHPMTPDNIRLETRRDGRVSRRCLACYKTRRERRDVVAD